MASRTPRLLKLAALPMAAALALTACGGTEETKYEMKEEGLDSEISYFHKGDKIIRQEMDATIDVNSLAGGMDVDSVWEMMKPEVEKYEQTAEDVDGFDYEYEYADGELEQKVKVDLEKIDDADLEKIPGGEDLKSKDGDYSMEETAKELEKAGFEKVED